jgi:hypothetical protein
LDFTAAALRADLGVERAARAAERRVTEWVSKAAQALKTGAAILHLKGTEEFTIERLRDLVQGSVPKPPDGRAWGSATRYAATCGYIERIPGHFAPAASSNGSPKPLYRKGTAE